VGSIDPFAVAFFLFLGAIVAGYLGALLGLGGGFLLVPLMTVLLGVDIRIAIAVSIIAVVATSTGSGAASVRRGVANTRLGMFLEVATSAGAIGGAFLALALGGALLLILFGIALLCAIPFMIRPLGPPDAGIKHPLSEVLSPGRLRLNGHYEDASGRLVPYHVHRPGLGFALSGFAGLISGLLGIGGGIVKVPTMHAIMGVPIKVATGTSAFMIGVTASAAALVYFARGTVDPLLASSAAIGVVVGTRFGGRMQERMDTAGLVRVFAVVLALVALTMFLKAAGVLP
jgi:uncharacterized membrane protein YfcA